MCWGGGGICMLTWLGRQVMDQSLDRAQKPKNKKIYSNVRSFLSYTISRMGSGAAHRQVIAGQGLGRGQGRECVLLGGGRHGHRPARHAERLQQAERTQGRGRGGGLHPPNTLGNPFCTTAGLPFHNHPPLPPLPPTPMGMATDLRGF